MISLTQRQIEVACRWTEVHLKKMFLKLEQQPDRIDYLEDEVYEENSYTIALRWVKSCRESDRGCECVKYVYPQFMMYYPPYRYRDIMECFTVFHAHEIKFTRDCLEKHKTLTICPCGRLGKDDHDSDDAKSNGKCNNCYIYGFERGEECSICKEDDGKPWIKTSCGHFFHELCWSHVIPIHHIKKCPLCRTEQNHVEKCI